MDEALQSFLAIAGTTDHSVAQFFLDGAHGDVQMAINNYLETQGAEESVVRPTKRRRIDTDRSDDSDDVIIGRDPFVGEQDAFPVVPGAQDDEVRAPIRPRRDRLMQPNFSAPRRPRAPVVVDNVFEGLRHSHPESGDFIIGGSDPQKQHLADLFSPPFDILARGSLEQVSHSAVEAKKLLLVNVQEPTDFECLKLNRDTWSDNSVKQLIRKHFTLWQCNRNSQASRQYLTYYKMGGVPHLAVLDPETGELLWHFDGFMSAFDLRKELIKFVKRAKGVDLKDEEIDLTVEKPLILDESDSRIVEELDELSEDAQLEEAIRLSMLEKAEDEGTAEKKDDEEKVKKALKEKEESITRTTSAMEARGAEYGAEAHEYEAAESDSDDEEDLRTCVLQIRLPGGKAIQMTFKAKQTLGDVFAATRLKQPALTAFHLISSFPRMKFEEQKHKKLTLAKADLLPRAALMVEEDT